MSSHSWCRFVFAALGLLSLSSYVQALDPGRRITQYVHDSWTPRSGAPTSTIVAIAQSSDGYLWLGTQSEGLVRFDGVRFTRATDLDDLFPIKTDEVRSLLAARDGALWVGMPYGLVERRNGRWTLLEEGRGRSVDSLVELADGAIAFARERVGFGVVHDGRIMIHRSGEPENTRIAVTDDGVVWLGTKRSLLRFDLDGVPLSPALTSRVNALYHDRAGRLWAATRAGLHRFIGGRLDAGPNDRGSSSDPAINALYEDRGGSTWIATTTNGLVRLAPGGPVAFTSKHGLTNDNVTALYEDREASLWVGTAGGLDRFRDGAFVPFGRSEGLANDSVASVLESRDGTLWAFTDGGGLNRIDPDGRVRVFTMRDGLATNFGGPLFESRDGSLWIGHDRGLTRFQDGVGRAFRSAALTSGYVSAISEDDEGLLVYILQRGLHRFKNGRLAPYRLRDNSPLTVRMPFSMHRARDGTLWLATVGGVIAVKNGVARTVWRLPRAAVATSIHEDREGILWIGTWHGLLRVDKRNVSICGVAHGLYHRQVLSVLEDRRGYLWLSCPRGIYRVRKRELEEFAAGRRRGVTSEAYGYPDGMRTSEAIQAAQPAGCATRDGRLWFTTRQGLVAVDPDRLFRNPLPPLVVIEEVLVDGRSRAPSALLDVPAGFRRVELRYNGLSLLVPERVRFRFRLEGYDDGWVEGDTRRSAFYTNLPPGRHVFRVTACNNDGVWNERGASVILRVEPRWYQRTWFYLLCCFVTLGTVVGAHSLRVHRLRRRERLLEKRVRERTAALNQEIVERERAQAALQESEERFELAVQGTNEGIWDWDLGSDSIYFSSLWKALLGYGDDEIENRTEEWFSRIHPEDVERVRAKLLGYHGSQTAHYADEYRMRHQDGGYRWMLARGFAVRDASGSCQRLVGAMTDVTERRTSDPLTGLPNRARFMERVEEVLVGGQESGRRRFAVLLLDLDRFKIVNESLGHQAGDQLLVAVARRVECCLRPEDIVARFHGAEFAVLVCDIDDPRDAVRVVERIQRELTRPFTIAENETFASVTVGIAVSSDLYARAEEILRDADTALHVAKERGYGRHEVFQHGMRARAVTTLELENALRRGIEQGELVMHYQPIVALATGRVEGFEALVRWNHPTRGTLLPSEFISLAEQARIIAPLGRWVRHEVCRQLRAWRTAIPAADSVWMSVNVSAREFTEPDLARELRSLLRETRVPPRRLRIEITETTLMAGDLRVAATLERLQALQIPLDIDDFGTGYSSLGYLQQLPVSALKIDRSFIEKLGPDEKNFAFLQTMVSLARGLGIPVVAEGVETEEQLAQVRRAGCDRAQGFLLSRPVDAERAVAFIGATIDFPG